MDIDGGIGWAGPPCPVCGLELDVEVLPTGEGLGVAYSCRVHGTVSVGGPFDPES